MHQPGEHPPIHLLYSTTALPIEETKSTSKIVHVPYSEAYGEGFEDMERRVPNIQLIQNLVGWKPTRDLSTIISDIALEMSKTN